MLILCVNYAQTLFKVMAIVWSFFWSVNMQTEIHRMSSLFAQLGLDSEPEAIEDFIANHKLPADVAIQDAPYWQPSQAKFLRDSLQEDAEWCEIIDELSIQLR